MLTQATSAFAMKLYENGVVSTDGSGEKGDVSTVYALRKATSQIQLPQIELGE